MAIITLPLTDEESTYLLESMGIWTEQYEDAQRQIVLDASLDSPEDLLDAYAMASDDINRGKSILARIQYLREQSG